MSSTTFEIKGITAKDLCDIIKVCSDCGVARFSVGDLEIDFTRYNSDQIAQETSVLSDDQNDIADDYLVKDEVTLRQEQLDQALVDDPALYDRLINQEDIKDDDQDDRGTE